MNKSYLIILLVLINIFCFAQEKEKFLLKQREINLPFEIKVKVPDIYPKVGLVLSGGGARGLAQIGVIQSLYENKILFEYIAGTSMGSIVGGLLSSGYSIDDLKNIAGTYNWVELITLERVNRSDLFIDQKVTEDKSFFNLQLDGIKPIIPNAWSSGSKVAQALNTLVANAPINSYDHYDEMLYKYSVIATDMGNGIPLVLKSGPLSKAMRASSSFSLLLPPVKFDSILVADGGLVANIPVKLMKKNGADYIIAVNSTSPLHDKNDLINPWMIADQSISIPMAIINNQNLEDANFIIQPKLTNKGSSDFSNVKPSIDSGYVETNRNISNLKESLRNEIYSRFKNQYPFFNSLVNSDYLIEKIEEYLSGDYSSFEFEINEKSNVKINLISNPYINTVSYEGVNEDNFYELSKIVSKLNNTKYNPYKIIECGLQMLRYYRDNLNIFAKINQISFNPETNHLNFIINEGIIDSIEIKGNKRTNITVITRELVMKENTIFTSRQLKNSLANLYSTNLFEDVEISLVRKNEKNIVVVNLQEKVSRIARFGLRVDNEYLTQVLIDVRDENLFGTGTEIGTTFFSGLKNRSISLEHKSNRIFDTYFNYKLRAYHNFIEIKEYENDIEKEESSLHRVSNSSYKQIINGIALGAGTQVERFGNLFAELRYERNMLKNLSNFQKEEDFKLLAFKASLNIDSMNDYPYPTSGFYVNTFYETAQQLLGAREGYSKFYFDYEGIFSIDRDNAFKTKLQIGFADQTLPLSQHFNFGGQNSFFGLKEYEQRGRQILIASLEYRYKVPLKIIIDPYIKLRYDLGSIWPNKNEIKLKDLQHAVGLSLSFNTPIGPADFSVGQSFIIKDGLFSNGITAGPLQFYFTIGYYY